MSLELDAPATTTLPQILHPLDPLSAQEITTAVSILRTSGKLGLLVPLEQRRAPVQFRKGKGTDGFSRSRSCPPD